LSGAAARTPVHTRSIACTSYRRADGLWDIEARIEDRKHYAFSMLEGGPIPADAPYHGMQVTFTVDDRLKVVRVVGEMPAIPFEECRDAPAPLQRLVGLTLGRGWRKAVDAALGRSGSCTHMREMLYLVPSAAIQAIPGYGHHMSGRRWPPEIPATTTEPPHFIGGCVSWRQDGAVVLRHYPQFHKAKP
jgi:hypothetical protein